MFEEAKHTSWTEIQCIEENKIVATTSGGSGTGGRGNLSGGGDPTDLRKDGWGIVIPRGDRGMELFRALEPLVQWRASQLGVTNIEPLVISGDAMFPKNREEADEGGEWCEDWPKYLLIVGGVEEISFDAQRALLASGKCVGRLVFAHVGDYATYAKNVTEWEKRDCACADLGYLVATGTSDVGFGAQDAEGDPKPQMFNLGFWIQNLGERDRDSHVEGPPNEIHPLRLIQWALLRREQPLPLFVRLPVEWLVSDIETAHIAATWRLHDDLGTLTGALQEASMAIAKRSKVWRVGYLLSTRANDQVLDEVWATAESGRPISTMVLGDPAVYMRASVETKAQV